MYIFAVLKVKKAIVTFHWDLIDFQIERCKWLIVCCCCYIIDFLVHEAMEIENNENKLNLRTYIYEYEYLYIVHTIEKKNIEFLHIEDIMP